MNTSLHWSQLSLVTQCQGSNSLHPNICKAFVTRVNWPCENNIVTVNLEERYQICWVIANNYFKLAYQLTFDLTKLLNLHTLKNRDAFLHTLFNAIAWRVFEIFTREKEKKKLPKCVIMSYIKNYRIWSIFNSSQSCIRKHFYG